MTAFESLGEVVVGRLETEGLVEWEVRPDRRLISRSDPECYVLLLGLAMSLWVFGFVQQILDTQKQEALDAAQDAVSLFAELGATEPGA